MRMPNPLYRIKKNLYIYITIVSGKKLNMLNCLCKLCIYIFYAFKPRPQNFYRNISHNYLFMYLFVLDPLICMYVSIVVTCYTAAQSFCLHVVMLGL